MSLKGLDRMTEQILAEARKAADGILTAAEDDCARIRAEGEARAEVLRTRLTDEAEREGALIVARARAAAEQQKNTALLGTRAAMVDSVFESARESVRRQSTEEYTALLAGLLAAAMLDRFKTEQAAADASDEEDVMDIPARYEVLLNARDRERVGSAVVDAARARLSGKIPKEMLGKLTLGDSCASIDGGLVLRCGAVELNCSLVLLFSELRRTLTGDVSRALFEERK